MSDRQITVALCATLVLSMAGFATFSAVVPALREAWTLSHTEIGWASGLYYAGYTALVPVLAALSDRIDPRRILIGATALAVLASAAFAAFAHGLAAALVCQLAAGVALAGIYMPGLKALADHIHGPRQGRYVSFYTSSFTIGTSLSFLGSGLVAAAFGWRSAFAAAALTQAAALAIAWTAVPPGTGAPGAIGAAGAGALKGAATKIARSEAMDYILAYAAHMWELFAMRAWLVPFLVYSQSLQPRGGAGWNAAAAASLVTLVGVPASIGGQELASRLGPRRHIAAVMIVSATVGASTGWAAALPFPLVVLICAAYSVTISADSAPLTAAAVAAAPPGLRGATMAAHSMLGFAAAFLGSLAIGAALDALGGDTRVAWGVAFGLMGVSNLIGVFRVLTGSGSMPRAAKTGEKPSVWPGTALDKQ
jgi:MFS family permease